MAGIAALAVCVAAWSLGRGKWVLEARHASTSVVRKSINGGTEVVVSGWIMHSGLCVDSVGETRDGDRIILRVKLAELSHSKVCTSAFSRTLRVPSEVHEIWLGVPREAIFIGNLFFGRWLVPSPLHDWFCGHGGEVVWHSANVPYAELPCHRLPSTDIDRSALHRRPFGTRFAGSTAWFGCFARRTEYDELSNLLKVIPGSTARFACFG